MAELSKRLDAIQSEKSLRQNVEPLLQESKLLPTTIVVQLLKKAGDCQANDLLPVIYDRYFEAVGYTDIVTAEVINQYCRSYNLVAIRDLYNFLTAKHSSMSGAVYEKFFSSLLRSIDNERLCLNIAKEMLFRGHRLSLKVVNQALSLPAACDSEMIITILRLANPRELPVYKMLPILNKRIVSLSNANRCVSVYEIYKYIALISPNRDHSALLPYVTRSFEYFVERCGFCFLLTNRNLSITYNSDDPLIMRALTRALLTKKFSKPEQLRDFVDFVAISPIFHGVKMDEFFVHVVLYPSQ